MAMQKPVVLLANCDGICFYRPVYGGYLVAAYLAGQYLERHPQSLVAIAECNGRVELWNHESVPGCYRRTGRKTLEELMPDLPRRANSACWTELLQ